MLVRIVFLILVSGLFAANCLAQVKPQPTPTPDADDEVLRVETELVSVPAVVTDKNGVPLTKLTAKNFAVFENNQPQQIENFATADAPFEIALLLDTSGSTRNELNLIKRAAAAFIKALRPGDKVAIVAFKQTAIGGQRAAAIDVLSDLTGDRVLLNQALEKAQTSNGTPFYDALETIAEKVFAAKPTLEQRGRRAIVALTDGVDSTSDSEFADARNAVGAANLAVYFVQVNTEDFVEDRVMGSCDDETAMRFSRVQMRRYQKMLKPRTPNTAKPPLEDFCQMGQFERMSISRQLYRVARGEMQQLARNTGGKTFPAVDLTEARQAFAQVAAEIGTLYSIGYYSTNQKRDGTFRQIRVEPRNLPAGSQIKAREGYLAKPK